MKTKKLPPHSWEPHHLADHAEANKQLVIMVVSIVAVIILAVALFMVKQGAVAGKAIEFNKIVPPNTGGIFVKSGTEPVGQPIVVPINLNIGDQQSVAVSFVLTYDPVHLTADCSEILKNLNNKFKIDGEDLSVRQDVSCLPGTISVSYAGLCADEECSNAITGTDYLAFVKFTASQPGTYTLKFNQFIVYDLETGEDLNVEKKDGEIVIEAPPACGNGKLDEAEECDLVNDYCSGCKLTDKYLYGDVNLDGTIDVTDQQCFNLVVLNKAPACQKVFKDALDFNCDETVNVVDLQAITQRLLKAFPSGVDANGNNLPDCKEEVGCFDPDNSYDAKGVFNENSALTKTTLTGVIPVEGIGVTDFCTDDQYLQELSCAEEEYAWQAVDCSALEGAACKEGACVLLSATATCEAFKLLEGESIYKTIVINDKQYMVSLVYVDGNSAMFKVNGEILSKLGKDESEVLADGAILTVTDIVYQAYTGGVHSASFTLSYATNPENKVCGTYLGGGFGGGGGGGSGGATKKCTTNADCSECANCVNGYCNTVDLSDYPDMFVKDGVFNGYMVVGEKAPSIDNLAMTDIAANIKYESEDGQMNPVQIVDATKLDFEIVDYKAQNLIVVGNPCVNTVAADLLGNPANCVTGFTPGESKIKLFKHANGKYTLLVAGYSGTDDRLAAKVLAHRWKELSGWEVKIEGTTYTDATITKVSDSCVKPITEICDGIDNDGDGLIDVTSTEKGVTSVCVTKENCETFGSACVGEHTQCKIGIGNKGASMCVCEEGYTHYTETGCSLKCTIDADCPAGSTCYTSCPNESLGCFGPHYCVVQPTACSTTNLAECKTEAECTTINGIWKDSLCTIKPECTVDNDCTAPKVCTNNKCVEKTVVSPLKIEVSDETTGALKVSGSDKLNSKKKYKIKVTANPQTTALPDDHLVITQITVEDIVKTIYWQKKSTVALGNSENVELTYDVPEIATGNIKVKAFVWNGWLGTNAYQELIPPANVSYTIG